MENKENRNSLQAVVLITTVKNADKAVDILHKGAVPVQYRFHGEGTASNELMDLLGLGNIEKGILITILPKPFAEIILNKLKQELRLESRNSGIAFTIPITSSNQLILYKMINREQYLLNHQKWEGNKDMSDYKYALVAAIVNRGYSESVMEAAREEGAKGGTVINSRQITNEEISSFWGISLPEEKEIVLIISDEENKVRLIERINQHCGMQSEAKGLMLSLPVDMVVGM